MAGQDVDTVDDFGETVHAQCSVSDIRDLTKLIRVAAAHNNSVLIKSGPSTSALGWFFNV